jgi:hypothetical protein
MVAQILENEGCGVMEERKRWPSDQIFIHKTMMLRLRWFSKHVITCRGFRFRCQAPGISHGFVDSSF